MDGGWMDRKKDGWLDGQKKIYEKRWMVGWIKNRWMVGWIYKKRIKKRWMVGWIKNI